MIIFFGKNLFGLGSHIQYTFGSSRGFFDLITLNMISRGGFTSTTFGGLGGLGGLGGSAFGGDI